MKRKGKAAVGICLFMVFWIVFCFRLPVSAAEERAPEAYVEDFANGLPPEAAAVGDAIRGGTLTEFSDMASLCAYLWGFAESEIVSLRETFSTLLGLLLLLSLSSVVKPTGQSGNFTEFGVTLVAAVVLYRLLYHSVLRVGAYLDDLTGIATVMAPAMSVLQVAGGNSAGMAVTEGGMAYFLMIVENLCRSVLLPLVNTSFGFVAVGALGNDLPVGGVLRTVRHLYMTILGFFSMLLCASLGMQSALSSASDNLLFKGARYAVGNLVPVVGGTLGSTLQTAAASVMVLKQTVGVGGAVAVLFVVLPLFIELLLTRTLISLSAGVTEMMGAARATSLFGDLRGVYDMMIAITVISSLVFLFMAAIFAQTACAVA